jgi:hypothetical protein
MHKSIAATGHQGWPLCWFSQRSRNMLFVTPAVEEHGDGRAATAACRDSSPSSPRDRIGFRQLFPTHEPAAAFEGHKRWQEMDPCAVCAAGRVFLHVAFAPSLLPIGGHDWRVVRRALCGLANDQCLIHPEFQPWCSVNYSPVGLRDVSIRFLHQQRNAPNLLLK